MLNPQMFGCRDGVVTFIPRVTWRGDSEGCDIASEFSNGPTNQTGINAATQQGAHRDVRLQPSFDCPNEKPLGFFYRFRKRWSLGRICRRLPVFSNARVSI